MGSLRSFVVKSGRATVYFGIDSITNLEKWISDFSRIYIVTGKKSARVSGALDDVLKILNRFNVRYEHFDGVVPNPTTKLIDVVAEKMWRFGVEAVIAIGGGSAIDTAKIACVLVECGGKAEDYLKGRKSVCGSIPLAAINLTHGTGTEIDRYAVATIEETNEKLSIASDYVYPSISIDDPKYLKTLPKNQTIYTSLDALYHAIESSTSKTSSPYTEVLGEEAVKLIAKWLPIAVKEPENIEARYWLLYASMIAGIGIDHGRTHLIHAMEHALSGLKPELAHGAGLAIIGPYIVEHIYKHVPETMHRLLKHIDPSLRPVPEDAEKARNALIEFQKKVGFDEKLKDYGFKKGDFDKVAKLTMESLKYLVNLAPFDVDKDLLKDIYSKAL